jgi:pimeloyl-ACP methyl ester carboxylesterase
VQVNPQPAEGAPWKRSQGQVRAVVLIEGLHLHTFSDSRVHKPVFRDWQQPGSTMVKTLAKDSDVFAFAYGQDVAVDEIAGTPALGDGIWQLRLLGYTEIVLVGHSAGGLVARQFVEDFPRAGVTKVVQVCAPNGGSTWSKAKVAVRPSQGPFMDSLTKEKRQLCLKERAGKEIPAWVQFVCIVGNSGGGWGDGIVTCRRQWTEDLQIQGIPVLPLATTHFLAMRTHESAEKIAAVIRENDPRWDAAQVNKAKHKLFGTGHE